VEVGDLVTTQWPGDHQWYRAKVVQVFIDEYDETKVDIIADFVDYGDFDRKPLSDFCNLRPEFLKLSFQAIPCSLAFVEPR
jgi:hypothetical protein